MSSARFEPAIPESERPQTNALDRAVPETGNRDSLVGTIQGGHPGELKEATLHATS